MEEHVKTSRRLAAVAASLATLMFFLCTGPVRADAQAGWVTAEFTQELPGSFVEIQAGLFDETHFELIGKLLSVFLHDKDKAYLIRRVGEHSYSIMSRRTIQEGSRVSVVSMTPSLFSFTGTLILKRGFSFTCEVDVRARYTAAGDADSVRAVTNVAYNAPAVVEGLDKLYRVISGRTFVAYKVSGFIERINIVFEMLGNMRSDEWLEISSDREFLEGLHYPVEFTRKEREYVAALLD